MLQREVADRIEAKPGTKDYGVLSIFVQLHADVRRVLSLPPGAFRPAPKVRSAVTRFTFRPPAVTLADEGVFNEMVRSMFTQRRKTLSNALEPFARVVGSSADEALRTAGIDGTRRAETLQLTELARLADYFAAAKKPSCAIVPPFPSLSSDFGVTGPRCAVPAASREDTHEAAPRRSASGLRSPEWSAFR